MSPTTAFLFLFITIVIPGFIFQRIYFYGDFSKQFTTKENVAKLLLTSLIPGLIISSIYLPCYNYFSCNDVKIKEILTLFEKLSNNKAHENIKLLNYKKFLIYCLFEFITAGSFGFLFSRALVRGLKLDRKWKTLRYKNQWYYVFSGEIFEFHKFKRATKTLSKKARKGKDVELAKADILIKGSEGNELYTGFVADYDLNPTDISKLDNVYLLDATRYKTIELNESISNLKQPSIEEKKLIPGELFVLSLSNMININVSYLLAPIKDKIPGEINKSLSLLIRSFCFFVLFPIAIFIFYNPKWMNWFSFSEIKWYFKIPIFSLYMNLVALIFPRYNNDKKVYFYTKRDLIVGAILLLSMIIYFCLIGRFI